MNSRGFLLGSVSLSFVLLMAALFAVSPASAQTISSVNVLAYADLNLSAGSNFITNPFSKANNTISNLFPSMPSNSYLRIWDGAIGDWGPTNSFSAGAGWSDPNITLFLPQGSVMWVPTPAQISFSGEVIQGSVTGRLYSAGIYILGVIPRDGIYVCGNFNECGAGEPPSGTYFCKWDRPQQRCASYQYFNSGGDPGFPSGWYDAFLNLADPKLEAGESGLFSVPSSFAAPGLSAPPLPPGSGWGRSLENPHRVGTSLTFQFTASNGVPYSIERSTNLLAGIWESVHDGNASNAPTTVTLTDSTNAFAFYRVRPPTPFSAPYLLNDSRTPGQFSFQFHASTNAVYEVQRSIAITPASWQTIGSISVSAKSSVSFTDSNAVASTGYYRVRFNP